MRQRRARAARTPWRGARARACSLSPASELSTRSAPRPPVPRRTSASNAHERLSPMRSGSRPGKRASSARRFASVPHVVYTCGAPHVLLRDGVHAKLPRRHYLEQCMSVRTCTVRPFCMSP